MAIKVVAFNGSPRVSGNTAQALQVVLDELETEGIETELVQLRPLQIHECIACYKCRDNQDRRCGQDDDDLNQCLEKILAADGIILGSPTFFGGMASKLKALVDRAGIVCKVNGLLINRKVGAPVVVARRQGATDVYHGISNFFAINGCIMVGSSYWNMAIGKDPGEIANDEEGQETLRNLGQNMAWLIHKLND